MRYASLGAAITLILCAVSWIAVWAVSGNWKIASTWALVAALPAIFAADYVLQSFGVEDDHMPSAEG